MPNTVVLNADPPGKLVHVPRLPVEIVHIPSKGESFGSPVTTGWNRTPTAMNGGQNLRVPLQLPDYRPQVAPNRNVGNSPTFGAPVSARGTLAQGAAAAGLQIGVGLITQGPQYLNPSNPNGVIRRDPTWSAVNERGFDVIKRNPAGFIGAGFTERTDGKIAPDLLSPQFWRPDNPISPFNPRSPFNPLNIRKPGGSLYNPKNQGYWKPPGLLDGIIPPANAQRPPGQLQPLNPTNPGPGRPFAEPPGTLNLKPPRPELNLKPPTNKDPRNPNNPAQPQPSNPTAPNSNIPGGLNPSGPTNPGSGTGGGTGSGTVIEFPPETPTQNIKMRLLYKNIVWQNQGQPNPYNRPVARIEGDYTSNTLEAFGIPLRIVYEKRPDGVSNVQYTTGFYDVPRFDHWFILIYKLPASGEIRQGRIGAPPEGFSATPTDFRIADESQNVTYQYAPDPTQPTPNAGVPSNATPPPIGLIGPPSPGSPNSQLSGPASPGSPDKQLFGPPNVDFQPINPPKNNPDAQSSPNPPPAFNMPLPPLLPKSPPGFANPQGQSQSQSQSQSQAQPRTSLNPGWSQQTNNGLKGQFAPPNSTVTELPKNQKQPIPVLNPVGADGKLAPIKRDELEQQKNPTPAPVPTPALCQNPCIADLQRNQRDQQNNDQLTTVTFNRFVMWNRLTGRPIYSPESVQVPAAMAPFVKVMGDRTADIRARHGLAEVRAKLAQMMQIVNVATTLHNAAMLSTSLAQTLGEVVTQSVQTFGPFFGLDQTTADAFDANEILGKAIDQAMASAIGQENWNGTKEAWKKANRIISTASNIIWTVRSIGDSARDIAEWTAENTGKIGNALKRFRVVGENAYSWMPERINSQNAWQRKVDRFREGIESVDDAASSLSGAVGEVRSITDEFKDLKEQKENFDKALKEAMPKARPDNDATKQAATAANAASKSPNLEVSDRAKGEDN